MTVLAAAAMLTACSRPSRDVPETGASRVDAGGYHADCVVTIGDAVTVQVSATGPDDATASAAAVRGIRRWLEGVGAVAHRG